MSRLGRGSLRWVVGGALCAAVLLAATWGLLIVPQGAQRQAYAEDAAKAKQRVPALQQLLTQRRKQAEHLAEDKAKLDALRLALPAVPSLSDLLRELQTAGDASQVSVSGLNVGGVVAVPAAGSQVYAFPLSLTAKGAVEKLNAFLDQLQQVQPRALLIDSAVLTVASATGSDQPAASLALTLKAFVSPRSATAVSSPRPSD